MQPRRRVVDLRDLHAPRGPMLLRAPLDGSVALPATRLRSRPLAVYLALRQLLLVDWKYPGVDAHTWARLLHHRWLDLVHSGTSSALEKALPLGRRGAAALIAAAGGGPTDPCFDIGGACGENGGRGWRLRARLWRAQQRASRAFGGAREAVRSGIRTVRSTMPQLPPQVRGWWRSVQGSASGAST